MNRGGNKDGRGDLKSLRRPRCRTPVLYLGLSSRSKMHAVLRTAQEQKLSESEAKAQMQRRLLVTCSRQEVFCRCTLCMLPRHRDLLKESHGVPGCCESGMMIAVDLVRGNFARQRNSAGVAEKRQ